MSNQRNFPDPGDYPRDSPEWAVAEFLRCWYGQHTGPFKYCCTKTWWNINTSRQREQYFTSLLFYQKHLKKAEIRGRTELSPVMIDVDVYIEYTLREGSTEIAYAKIATARVIREADTYKPSPDGTWGVNPVSFTRERDVEDA